MSTFIYYHSAILYRTVYLASTEVTDNVPIQIVR